MLRKMKMDLMDYVSKTFRLIDLHSDVDGLIETYECFSTIFDPIPSGTYTRLSSGEWVDVDHAIAITLESDRKELIMKSINEWYHPVKNICKWLVALKYLVDWSSLIDIDGLVLVDILRYIAKLFSQYVANDILKRNPHTALACCLFNINGTPLPIYKTGRDLAQSLKHNIVSSNYYSKNHFCICCWHKIRHSKGKKICNECIVIGEEVNCISCEQPFVSFRNRYYSKKYYINLASICSKCVGRQPPNCNNIAVEEFKKYRSDKR